MRRLENIFAGLSLLLLLTAGPGRAETVFWSDNFETNAASHWTATSPWHIGSPTAGPALNAAGFRTHSAAKCASTQNYPANQDVRLLGTNYNGAATLLVPAADQFPRLRFWHWFNFANAAGYVEISTDNGGTWTQISPTYINANGGGIWSRPAIDLTAYAGQSVQIAFHFVSGIGGNALGWFVDDVAVVTDAPKTFPESFESGPTTNDWAVQSGTWEIGKPTSGPNAAHTGTNCAGTILAGNYPNNVDSRLISPPFEVPASGPVLSFWHWYSFNNAEGFVEISTNGINWNQVSPTYLNGSTGGAWTNVFLNLSSYAGQTVQAAFRFGSGLNTAAGWYVDDITLLAAPVLTVPPTQKIFVGQTLIVTNFATNSILPGSTFTFGLPAPSTKVVITTNGVLTWTNTAAPPGTNVISVKVTDHSVPPLSATNSFLVIVLPLPPVLIVSRPPATNHSFKFSFQTSSNTTWRIDASTNLVNWQPLWTNTVGASGTLQVTDLLATNFLRRFYRAVFP